MPEPQTVLTEEEIFFWWEGIVDKPADKKSEPCVEFARRLEAMVLAKRDAEWREAAKAECSGYGWCEDNQPRCAAHRTVARMEGK